MHCLQVTSLGHDHAILTILLKHERHILPNAATSCVRLVNCSSAGQFLGSAANLTTGPAGSSLSIYIVRRAVQHKCDVNDVAILRSKPKFAHHEHDMQAKCSTFQHKECRSSLATSEDITCRCHSRVTLSTVPRKQAYAIAHHAGSIKTNVKSSRHCKSVAHPAVAYEILALTKRASNPEVWDKLL
jgi:hypothetical protein